MMGEEGWSSLCVVGIICIFISPLEVLLFQNDWNLNGRYIPWENGEILGDCCVYIKAKRQNCEQTQGEYWENIGYI